MENKFDNENVRRQLYKFYGEKQGKTYGEFKPELDKMVEDMYEQSKKTIAILKEYSMKHRLCPICKSEKYSTTLVGYVYNPVKEYKDLNSCVCSNCGDRHTTHDRVEK